MGALLRTVRRVLADAVTCSTCGEPHIPTIGNRPCTGHANIKNDDGHIIGRRPCRRNAMAGQDKCGTHGGRSKQAKAAAAQRQQRERAEALMLTLGEPVPGSDPAEVVAERIDARRGHVRWLLARVQALEPDALTWGLTKRKTAVEDGRWANNDDEAKSERRRFGGTDEGDTHEAKPHVWFVLYQESARELERLCIEAIRAGIEERRVRVDERMADMWVRVIDNVLTDLGHDPNDPATAEIVARHLELVA